MKGENKMQNNLSNASIIGGIGSILTALGIFPLGIIGIILILVALNRYSKALNNPYVFRFASRWGIILFVSGIVFLMLIGISAIFGNSAFSLIITFAVLYIATVYAVIDFKRALIELSIALNHKLFKTAGAIIFAGTLLSPLIIPILLIFAGFIALAIAFFTAPKEVKI
jgi:uncharacterized membrane protein